MKSKRLPNFLLVIFFAGLLVTGYLLRTQQANAPENPAVLTIENQNQPQAQKPVNPPALPPNFFQQVPFTPQAPTANWDLLHNEACEEASLIMAKAFFEQRTEAKLAPNFVEEQIEFLTEWQIENLGYSLSVTSEEFVAIAEGYGLKAEIQENFEEEKIKQLLAQGDKLVVWAGDGRLLHNPNFKTPGPKYHMLIIKGFDTTGFSTHDPGTRKGANYAYSFKTLLTANGKYEHSTEEVNLSKKHIIILSRTSPSAKEGF
jgi:hypothetical protein